MLISELYLSLILTLELQSRLFKPIINNIHSFPLRKNRRISSVAQKDLDQYLAERMDDIALTNAVQIDGWTAHYEYTGSIEEYIFTLDLNPVPENIVTYLKSTGMLDIVNRTITNLTKIKKDKESFIKETEKANNDLIEMI